MWHIWNFIGVNVDNFFSKYLIEFCGEYMCIIDVMSSSNEEQVENTIALLDKVNSLCLW